MSETHIYNSIPSVSMLMLAVVLAACGSKPIHEQESFDPKAPYQYHIPTDPGQACSAANLALLSQGYSTEHPAENQIKASKSFQPEDDRHVLIDFNVTCSLTRTGTVLFANAQESRFALKKNSQSAGISIASVGGITMPWGTSSESLVKVAGQTVSDPDFYRRFYDLIDKQLGIVSKH